MSMTREQMLRYMENPMLLNERTLGELKEILDEFPYFQSAHLLYVRNLMNESNFRFENQLKISAVHATDRKVLFQLLHPKEESKVSVDQPEVEIEIKEKAATSFELSDEMPITAAKFEVEEEKPAGKREKSSFDLMNFDSGDIGYKLDDNDIEGDSSLDELAKELLPTAVKKSQALPENREEDLIERFIRTSPTLQPRNPNQISDANPIENDEEQGENDDFITETLARIYMKQGLHQKAIEAFKRLSLKYPEKSVYFARQIEEITKLLNK